MPLPGPMPLPHGFLKGGPVPTGGSKGVMPFPHGFLNSGPATSPAAYVPKPMIPVGRWLGF